MQPTKVRRKTATITPATMPPICAGSSPLELELEAFAVELEDCVGASAMSMIVVYVSVDCAIVKVTKFVLVVEVVVRYGVGIASVCRVVVSDIDRARRAEAWTEPQSCCWRTEMMNNDMQRRLQKVGHYGPCLRRPFVRSFWRGWIAALLRSHHPRLCASSQ